jgi:hypothetical protein
MGRLETISGRQEESVHITSALVSLARADSLLRAAQLASDAYRFPIPSAESEGEITHPQFQLKGWILENDLERRLDEYDLWGGSIHFPGPQPASDVSALLNLKTDSDRRLHISSDSEKARVQLLSSVWGNQAERDHDFEGELGSTARVTPSFLEELLVRTGMELIVKVIIERRVRASRYETPIKGDFDGYLPPYSRIYIVGAGGQFRTL